jgi:hypothetical protein
MVPHFAAHEFQLATGLIGLMQFEKRDSQRKSRPQTKRGVGRQSGSEFSYGYVISV